METKTVFDLNDKRVSENDVKGMWSFTKNIQREISETKQKSEGNINNHKPHSAL